jgi:hypothetical protein
MARQLRIAFLSGLFMLSSLWAVDSARAQSKSPAKPQTTKAAMPVMAQMTNIPYFTLRDGMSSTLTLNNLASSPTPVMVTIYNQHGKAQMLDPITLDAHSFKEIVLRDVVVSEEFDSGNIEVAFNGTSMAVTCQVSVSNIGKRVSFESREADMMEFNSSKLNGILSLPQPGAEGFLALTDTSSNKVTVQLSVGSKQKTVTLYPRETQLVKLNEEFGQHGPADTVVKLQHSGLPGDIITTGYVLDLKDGYSSAFAMLDPATMQSSHLSGAHFRSGKPDWSEGFPAGTQFSSPLLLANVSDKQITAHVSVDYTVEGKRNTPPTDRNEADARRDKFSSVEEKPNVGSTDSLRANSTQDQFNTAKVKDLIISPGEVKRVELSDALGGVGQVEETGVDIAYDAPPGTIIGQLVSVDQSGDYSFEVPIKDPAGMNEMMEGVYPWTLENGTSTVLHLKNTTNKGAAGTVVFTFAGGTYVPDQISLKPYQTVAIDIQNLKDSKKLDVRKQVFPVDAMQGQIMWHQETPYSLIGRAEHDLMEFLYHGV